jgi:hypothetical protein
MEKRNTKFLYVYCHPSSHAILSTISFDAYSKKEYTTCHGQDATVPDRQPKVRYPIRNVSRGSAYS